MQVIQSESKAAKNKKIISQTADSINVLHDINMLVKALNVPVVLKKAFSGRNKSINQVQNENNKTC